MDRQNDRIRRYRYLWCVKNGSRGPARNLVMSPIVAMVLAFCVIGGILWSCATPQADRTTPEGNYTPIPIRHAHGLKLWRSDVKPASFIVEILDPRDTSAGVLHRYVLSANPDSGTSSILIPVKAAALGSTTFTPYFERIGAASRIKGVSYGDRVMDEDLKARLETGDVLELNSGERIDLERLLALGSDVFLTNDYGDVDLDRLSELGVHPLVLTEYLEPHPLGRAEWVMLFGALTGRLNEAQRVFDHIETAYREVKAAVDTSAERPRVFAGSRYGDFWYAPGGNSYLATFFHDAGADYVFADRRWSGNAQLDFEAALAAVADADYWGLILASQQRFTMDQLRAMDERYTSLRAFREGKVFVCNTSKSDYFGKAILEPQYVLQDLVRIFHGDTLGGGFRYFRPVER